MIRYPPWASDVSVVPQVYEDLRALTLSLDDVAEFTGALDEDLDDVGY